MIQNLKTKELLIYLMKKYILYSICCVQHYPIC